MVTAHVWRLRARSSAFGLAAAALPPRAVRSRSGARFARLLGTGSGDRFTLRDTRLRTWALIAAWDDIQDSRAFESTAFARSWRARSCESAALLLAPLASRGTWSGIEPFVPQAGGWDGPVAALTRARIATRRLVSFRRAIPAVAASLRAAPGCRMAIGIGEAPVAWQGTLSVWADTAALTAFAYRTPAHRAVIARTPREGWYREELFSRFAVLDARGSIDGASLGDDARSVA